MVTTEEEPEKSRIVRKIKTNKISDKYPLKPTFVLELITMKIVPKEGEKAKEKELELLYKNIEDKTDNYTEESMSKCKKVT